MKQKNINQKKKEIFYKILKEMSFYLFLLLFVVCVFFFKNNSGGAPTTIGGFSMMRVLTSSMETEIPKGSLIVTRSVEPETLGIGDDITYLINANTTITHRIVDITEEYLDTGERAFITQGVCNARPDSEPVAAVNVVGKVIYHNYIMGQILGFLQANWMFIIVLFGLGVALFHSLRVLFHKEVKEQPEEGKAESEREEMRDE